MTRIKLSVFGIIIGGLLLLMPGVALMSSVPEVNYAYWVITSEGMGDPAAVAETLKTIKWLSSVGISLWLLGAIVLAASLIVFTKASRSKTSPHSTTSPAEPIRNDELLAKAVEWLREMEPALPEGLCETTVDALPLRRFRDAVVIDFSSEIDRGTIQCVLERDTGAFIAGTHTPPKSGNAAG